MGQKDFNLEECQPQLADLKRCCERYQGKSIHCGFDPAVDPPDKHDVLLPDPDIPVTFEPAAPHTLGPGAKVKTTESYTPPVAKDNARKAAKEGTSSEEQLEGTEAKGDTYLALETKTGESQPKTAGQLSPVTLQRVEKHLGERDLAGAKIGDPAAALKKAAGNAAGTGPADKAAELSAERSGRASGPDTAEQGFVNGGKAAQQTQHAQRGSTEVAGGANGGNLARVFS
ncbi:hypothetical protein WJX75_004960 [Coccomyxa subellipsoidea]|uniref:Uncharacterized protein n=1 Tax=Coccomyxa subellipsoidea TaxID=248742 RepID=A0ABR2YD98_9CHLO